MKIEICSIAVKERIRKDVGDIAELAADIRETGLLNAITVMRTENGYQLLAGLRRLKAVMFLGGTEIEANVVEPKDAEAALRIEISENEQRKAFTFSEKAYFGKLLTEVEKAKALERKSIGGQGGFAKIGSEEPILEEPWNEKGRVRERIGKVLGISRTTYERINYLAENAPEEVIDELDRGERTIRGAYDELRAKEKITLTQDMPVRTEQGYVQPKTESESEEIRLSSSTWRGKRDPLLEKLKAEEVGYISKSRKYEELSDEVKISELERQLREERARAAGAESELAHEKELRENERYHYGATIEMLNSQLASANARIKELEERYGAEKHTV